MYKCAHCSRTFFTYQWASRAAMFWIICEFTRFLLAKTKRVRRLLSRSPNSSQFAIPPMAKSQVRQLSPLSPCETSPCFFGNPIKRSLRGADTNAFMSSCLTSASDENYISLINSAILIISTFGQGISFNGLKCLSFVTMYSASDATAQSTNLLSSESAGSNSK